MGYALTPKGKDAYPIILTLMKWGDQWLATIDLILVKAPRRVATHHPPHAALRSRVALENGK